MAEETGGSSKRSVQLCVLLLFFSFGMLYKLKRTYLTAPLWHQPE